jgi:sulfate transport system substrate-binding protein
VKARRNRFPGLSRCASLQLNIRFNLNFKEPDMWKVISLGLALVIGSAWWVVLADGDEQRVELLNVSYDPTRELWRELNEAFIPAYEKEKGVKVAIRQSHGGSASQARAVIDGLEADVVTLALFSDTDAIREKGLLASGWQKRLPNDSLPYYSTIVFVVRKGNPKGIKDWPDLVKGDVQIITPNPKTSGNGKLSFLAAWGSVLQRGGSEEQAREYVSRLYERVPVLDTGARGSTTTFAQKGIGDVHLTWENEAHLEVKEAGGALEIIYPPVSIKAEPYVAWVDANVKRKGTREVAEAYLRFLYTEAAQETIARHHYRPINDEVLKRHAAGLKPIVLFPITRFAPGWDEAQEKFFANGGVFDAIYRQSK